MKFDLTAIAFFASIFGIVYIFLNTRHKERLKINEKGVDASLFHSEKKLVNWSKITLKVGMFFMGIALGIFLAALLVKTGFLGKRSEDALYPSLIFFFGGLSLVLSYLIDRKKKEE
jgi:uncharacterized membrane protein